MIVYNTYVGLSLPVILVSCFWPYYRYAIYSSISSIIMNSEKRKLIKRVNRERIALNPRTCTHTYADTQHIITLYKIHLFSNIKHLHKICFFIDQYLIESRLWVELYWVVLIQRWRRPFVLVPRVEWGFLKSQLLLPYAPLLFG